MEFIKKLDSYHEEMVEALKASVAFNSVKTDSVRTQDGEVYPFGEGIHKCFMQMLDAGEKLGFTPKNVNNYGGHLEWKADPADNPNNELFAISCHLDVVPVGAGWDHDPFDAIVKDNVIYGRGVADDKGPLIACLYAMKALKESGLKPKKDIRLVLGLDEETGSSGMAKYLEVERQPEMGFTPDGDFPIIHGEKGGLYFEFAQKLPKTAGKEGIRITKLEAGTATNAVADNARTVIAASDAKFYDLIKDKAEKYTEETGHAVKTKKQGSSLVVETAGVSAHGAFPEKGLNAISIMMDFLGGLEFNCDELNDFITFFNKYIGFDLNGGQMGCEVSDEPSGKLTWCVGTAHFTEELAVISNNARYPVTYTHDVVFDAVEKAMEGTKVGLVVNDIQPPVYKELDSELVKLLMEAYVEETGDTESKPMVIGGGTYAKSINNTLAFGALFPGEDDTMHQANERMDLESFKKMSRIYANAIYKLCF